MRLDAAALSYGHGTTNARDEAAWLVLWSLGLPLDTDIDADPSPLDATAVEQALALVQRRIDTREPAAYLTGEAWLQCVPFTVDERVIVPRSLIAECLADATIDPSRGFHLSRQSGGALRLSLTDRNGTALAVTAPGRNPGAGVWTHIAATWSLRAGTNQSVLRLYVNGAQVAIVNGTRRVSAQARRMASCRRPAKTSRPSGPPSFHLPAVTLPEHPETYTWKTPGVSACRSRRAMPTKSAETPPRP